MEDISYFKPKLHVFVCINQRETGHPKPSCGPKMTAEQVKEIKHWILQNGWARDVYCTKVSCLGFCNPQGGVICIYPQGKFIKGIQNVDEIKTLIKTAMKEI